ncbi:MAG: tetratricopeptide repeat protein [Dongiaceae bacterium]
MAAILLCSVALPGCVGSITSNDTAGIGVAVAQPALNDGAYERGKDFFNQGQYGLALESFTRSLQIHPGAVRELNAMAACYDRMQRFDLAEQLYQQALAIEPNSAVTLNNLGYSYLMRGERAGDTSAVGVAWDYFEKARQLGGNNSVVAANLSKASAILAAADAAQSQDMASSLEGPVKLAAPEQSAWIERLSSKSVRVVTNSETAVAELAQAAKLPVQIVSISTSSHRELLYAEPAVATSMIASANDTAAPPSTDATTAPSEMIETTVVSVVNDNSGDLIEGAPASLQSVAVMPLPTAELPAGDEWSGTSRLHAEIFGGDVCGDCAAALPFLKDQAPINLLAEGTEFVQIAALPSSDFQGGLIEGPAPQAQPREQGAFFSSQAKKHAEGAVTAQVPYIDRPISWLIDLVLAD